MCDAFIRVFIVMSVRSPSNQSQGEAGTGQRTQSALSGPAEGFVSALETWTLSDLCDLCSLDKACVIDKKKSPHLSACSQLRAGPWLFTKACDS